MDARPEGTPLASGRARFLWAPAAICLAVLLAYANSFPGALFFDDEDAILRNASIRDLTAIRDVLWPPVQAGIGGRPFANLTFALNYALGGYHPGGYHAVNLAIHLAAALLLFGIVRRTFLLPSMRNRLGSVATALATLTALLWALHPLQTNIVDYLSQRTEGLMAALYLLTLYAFIRGVVEASRGWTLTAIVACALGMATKESMVTAPVIVWLYDRTFLSGSFAEAWRRHRGRYLGLAGTWLIVGALMLTSKLSARGIGFGLGQSGFDYALTETRTVVRYLQLTFWPHPLVFDYGPNYLHTVREALPSALVLAAVLAGIVVLLRRAPAAGFLGAWFFVLLSPSSSVIPVVQQPCAENRLYLPLAGAAVLAATLAYHWLGRRALAGLAIGALVLGIATWHRNPVFGSELAVWWDTVPKRPENARAANNLGNALLKVGRVAEAKPFFEKAVAVSPTYADAHNNRGVVLLREARPEEALEAFQTAIANKAGYADAYYNLGEAYLQLARPAEAIVALREALKLDPNNPKVHNNLGIALLDTGHIQESIAAEERAIALNPQLPEAHYNLANALSKADQIGRALQEYDATLRVDPRFARAHNNAGVIFLNQGRNAEAAARFEAALRLDPKYPEALKNLALARSRLAPPTAPTAQIKPAPLQAGP